MEDEEYRQLVDELLSEPEGISLGACCACHGTERVRNLVMHARRAPVAGTGWGCVVCGLPSDGAVSVLCDACLRLNTRGVGSFPATVEVCVGYPAENKRVPLASLPTDVFDHDMRFHQDEVA
jgi:hypothetical protein